jgi:hypothetical protein
VSSRSHQVCWLALPLPFCHHPCAYCLKFLIIAWPVWQGTIVAKVAITATVCQCSSVERASLRLVSSLRLSESPGATARGQWPNISEWLLQLTCLAKVTLPVQNQIIKIRTTHCSPLIKNIPKFFQPKVGFSLALQPNWFSESGHPNVVV